MAGIYSNCSTRENKNKYNPENRLKCACHTREVCKLNFDKIPDQSQSKKQKPTAKVKAAISLEIIDLQTNCHT